MQQWEYTWLSVYHADKDVWCFSYKGKNYLESELHNVMQQMGREGWELVGLCPFVVTTSPGAWAVTWTNQYQLYFKKPIV